MSAEDIPSGTMMSSLTTGECGLAEDVPSCTMLSSLTTGECGLAEEGDGGVAVVKTSMRSCEDIPSGIKYQQLLDLLQFCQ